MSNVVNCEGLTGKIESVKSKWKGEEFDKSLVVVRAIILNKIDVDISLYREKRVIETSGATAGEPKRVDLESGCWKAEKH